MSTLFMKRLSLEIHLHASVNFIHKTPLRNLKTMHTLCKITGQLYTYPLCKLKTIHISPPIKIQDNFIHNTPLCNQTTIHTSCKNTGDLFMHIILQQKRKSLYE